MARWLYVPPTSPYATFSVTDWTQVIMQYVVGLRDAFRNGWGAYSAFNTALPAGRWKVSDIGVTLNASDDPRGYYFLVRDTLHNLEYLFILPGEELPSNIGELTDYWTEFNEWQPYVQLVTSAPADAAGTGGQSAPTLVVYQNPDYATSTIARAFGFDDTTNLTYTGGDFSQVTTAPLTATDVATGWLPVGGVEYARGFGFANVDARASFAFMIDDVENALWVWGFRSVTATGPPYVDSMCVLAKALFRSNEPTDAYLMGGAWWEIRNSGTQLLTHTNAYAHGYDRAGNRVNDYTLHYRELFNREARSVAGEYQWRNIPAISPTFDKGWLRDVFARELGAAQSYASTGLTDIRELFQAPSVQLPMARYTGFQASAWVKDLPVFPFPFPEWGRADADVFAEDVTFPTDTIVQFDHTTAKWKDTAGTMAATLDGDDVDRIDNDGSLGGNFAVAAGQPTLDVGTFPFEGVAFNGSARMTLPDNDALTIAAGSGFEVVAVIQSLETADGKGVCGKWDSAGTTAEWRLLHSGFSTADLQFEVDGFSSSNTGMSLNSGRLHVVGGFHLGGDIIMIVADGRHVNTVFTEVTAHPANSTNPLHLGAYSDNASTYMTGAIVALYIWDRALSPQERTVVYDTLGQTYKAEKSF